MSRLVLVVVLACAVVPAAARAQTAAPPPPPRQEGAAEFAFVGTTGNASTQTIGLGAEYIFKPDAWVVTNKAAFVRNKAHSVLTAETLSHLFRAAHTLSARISGFGEYTYFRNKFAGVLHRHAVSGGVAFKVIEGPVHALSADAGFGFLRERRSAGGDASSSTWALGAGYRWKISPTAGFSDEVRMTGLFTDSTDWRLQQSAAITARLTQLLSLKVSHTIRHEHVPVPGFKRTDTNTSVALVARF